MHLRLRLQLATFSETVARSIDLVFGLDIFHYILLEK
jgi:hypothetical protein